MAKRFTATDKWNKNWFMTLSPRLKCVWLYLCDNCDAAGVWDPNWKLATFIIGDEITELETMAKLGDQLEKLENGKIFIKDFIKFQYGNLSTSSPAHQPIFKSIEKNNLSERVSGRVVNRVSNTLMEKEKDMDKGKDKEGGVGEIKLDLPEPITDELFSNYEDWTEQIIQKNDQFFEQMLIKQKLVPNGSLADLARSHLELLARYSKTMRPTDQHKFRHSLLKHIRENFNPETHALNKGNTTRNTQPAGTKRFSGDYSAKL